MGAFKYVPPREVAARHRSADAAMSALRGKTREPRQRNVEAVLSLGATRYFMYRRKTYAVPPVPFKLGQRVLTLYLETTALAQSAAKGNKQDGIKYFGRLKELVNVMWPHIRLTRRWKRVFKSLHLYRNPFRDASDLEVLDVTNFFLQGRMKSSVQSLETNPASETQMS